MFRPERKGNVPCMLFYSVIVADSYSGMYQAWDVSTKTQASTVVKLTFCREQKKMCVCVNRRNLQGKTTRGTKKEALVHTKHT